MTDRARRPLPLAIDAKRLCIAAAILLASLAAVLATMYAVWRFGIESAPATRLVLPPRPRLQRDPASDLQSYRAREQARLHGYAWVDRDAGIAHIPIERAMQMLVERNAKRRDDERAGGRK